MGFSPSELQVKITVKLEFPLSSVNFKECSFDQFKVVFYFGYFYDWYIKSLKASVSSSTYACILIVCITRAKTSFNILHLKTDHNKVQETYIKMVPVSWGQRNSKHKITWFKYKQAFTQKDKNVWYKEYYNIIVWSYFMHYSTGKLNNNYITQHSLKPILKLDVKKESAEYFPNE